MVGVQSILTETFFGFRSQASISPNKVKYLQQNEKVLDGI